MSLLARSVRSLRERGWFAESTEARGVWVRGGDHPRVEELERAAKALGRFHYLPKKRGADLVLPADVSGVLHPPREVRP